MSTSLTRFAMQIKTLRKRHKLSQQAVADKAGITREYLARLEAGEHDPSLSTVLKLAKALKVKVAELVE
jgi:transcriptional regulator with XRE-family HTH domain